MHRKLVWLSILSILFLIWGASGFAATSHRDVLAQSALPDGASTPDNPQATPQTFIPVTGSSGLGWGMLIFYGLIGFCALTLILALLDSANQSTRLYGQGKPLQKENNKGTSFPM